MYSEQELIAYLSSKFVASDSLFGIGDDCAVIPKNEKDSWLVTTDALVDGVHFLASQISARDVGYKAVAVSVSDIAAMGGDPKYAFLSIALPRSFSKKWVDQMFDGMEEACQKWQIQLLGGDTVGSKRDLFLNLTLIGSACSKSVLYRHHAQEGDIVFVNGHLGDSGGGLKALQTSLEKDQEVQALLQSHFCPDPRPDQGSWFASQPGVHSAMDLSDGLDCDLKKLLAASKQGAIIEISQLPISSALNYVCVKQGWDAVELALTGGEDYHLLLTAAPHQWEILQKQFESIFHTSLFPIGKISSRVKGIQYEREGDSIALPYRSFDHFE